MSVEINNLPVKQEALDASIFVGGEPFTIPHEAKDCEVFSDQEIAKARFLNMGTVQLKLGTENDKPAPKSDIKQGEREILRSEAGFRVARCIAGTCPFRENVETCYRRSDNSRGTDRDLYVTSVK